MESFFSSLKTERTARRTIRTRDDARADVFDYIERVYNPINCTKNLRLCSAQPPPLTPGGQELDGEMKIYWTNFIVSGTPNGHKDSNDTAFWPPFNPVTADIEALMPGPARVHPVVTFATDHKCAALAALRH